MFWIALTGFACCWRSVLVRADALPLMMAALYLPPPSAPDFQRRTDFSLDIIWILPLLGLILSGPARGVGRCRHDGNGRCHVGDDRRDRWPIVFLREADFAPWILPLSASRTPASASSPWDVGKNITYFAWP